MVIAALVLLVGCTEAINPAADAIAHAKGYQVLVCLPPGYAGAGEVFSGWVESATVNSAERIAFSYLGQEQVTLAALHCGLLPSMVTLHNGVHGEHYDIFLDEPLREDADDLLTLVYFTSTAPLLRGNATRTVLEDNRRGRTPVLTHVPSKGDRRHFAFNLVPTTLTDDVTVAVRPVPETGTLLLTR